MDWQPYLKKAYELALSSPDPSTQNGAIILDLDNQELSCGVNEFPRGVKYHSERWERPLKYKVIEHAERNAVYAATKRGISTVGLTMVCPWAACCDCARAIIQSGISRLVVHKQAHDRSPDRWKEDIDIAFTLLKEAKIDIVMFDGKVDAPEVLHSGEKWKP